MISLQDFLTHRYKKSPVPRSCVILSGAQWHSVINILSRLPWAFPCIYLADKIIHAFLISWDQPKEHLGLKWIIPVAQPSPCQGPLTASISHLLKEGIFSSLETFCKVTMMSSSDVQPWENRTDFAPGFLCPKCCSRTRF